MTRRCFAPLLLSLALLLLSPSVFAQSPGSGIVMTRIEPIPGLVLTALDPPSLNLSQGETGHLGVHVRNDGNETLQLRLDASERGRSDTPRFLALQLDTVNLMLPPGAEAIVRINVTLVPETPNGTQRSASLVAMREQGAGMTSLRFSVRAPGECVGCPVEEEQPPVVFTSTGPGGVTGDGSQVVQRPFNPQTDGNASSNGKSTTDVRDDHYDETPAFGLPAVLAALAGLAIVLRARREA